MKGLTDLERAFMNSQISLPICTCAWDDNLLSIEDQKIANDMVKRGLAYWAPCDCFVISSLGRTILGISEGSHDHV